MKTPLRALALLFAPVLTMLPVVGAVGAGGAVVYGLLSVGPGFVDNMENIKCADAGTLIQSSDGQVSLDCECAAAVAFGSEAVVPLDGKLSTTFNGNVRSVNCRSQANTLCDCWALTTTDPD